MSLIKKEKEVKVLVLVVIILILLPLALAFTGSVSNYNADIKMDTGSASNASSASYTQRLAGGEEPVANLTGTYGGRLGLLSYDTTPPSVTINLPVAGTTYTTSTTSINVTLGEKGSCKYSINNGATNRTLTDNDNAGIDFTATSATLSDATYTLKAYCNDTYGNQNYTESARFTLYAGTVTPTPTTPSTGGAGAGAGITPAVKFSVNKDMIKTMTGLGESFQVPIKITNEDTKPLNFYLRTNLGNLIILSESSFSIPVGETKEVTVTFFSEQDTTPDAYTGYITVTSGSVTKKVSIIYEVESERVLFDLTLDIPAKYKEVSPGEDVLVQLTLFNLGRIGRVDTIVTYLIKDFEGNILASEEETIAIEDQATLSRTLSLSPDVEPGRYIVASNIRYGNSVGVATDTFAVKGLLRPIDYIKQYLPFIVLASILAFVIYRILEHENVKLKRSLSKYQREAKKVAKRISEGKIKEAEAQKIKGRLRKQLGLLDEAYSKGYIKKESYESGKKRLKSVSNKLKKKYL